MKIYIVVLAVAVALCAAFPAEKEKEREDGYGIDIFNEKGVGTVVRGDGQKTWKSDDGKTDYKVYGDWSRVYNGPEAGGPKHKGGFSIRRRFDD